MHFPLQQIGSTLLHLLVALWIVVARIISQNLLSVVRLHANSSNWAGATPRTQMIAIKIARIWIGLLDGVTKFLKSRKVVVVEMLFYTPSSQSPSFVTLWVIGPFFLFYFYCGAIFSIFDTKPYAHMI